MNIHVDMTTLPRMSGECLAASLASSGKASGGRAAPRTGQDEIARSFDALRRPDLVGCSVSRVLPATGSDGAEGRDRDSEPTAAFVERMLSDPLIRLVMLADGVSEHEIRTLYRMRLPSRVHGRERPASSVMSVPQTAVPEPGPRPGTPRPGIGE
ncbi:hypothetical protein KM176_06385 [Pseudooceanicola sp. CBS1P-1]|uniref:Uncharacterized protein n=1 Tax=Pseudooceanicola albus TaxID=2692189 RepID=A0A6L7G1K5_9RHOB|nr:MULTISPECIES: hypothetical protein [Pseudooceanicola]MBT9383479.1 hypothetical protein [Pseudooceanicola endophyticus]MXN17336.1 hypothetical protein [Pseudooceanicola albus]